MLLFLDSERSKEASGFTMVLFLFYFLYHVYKTFTRRSTLILTYSTLSSSQLVRDGTLDRQFFDFLNNNYLMPQEKLLTINYEKPLKMGF